MFESCIALPSALVRHRSAPLAEERERFLAHLQSCGTGRGNLRTAAAYLLQIVRVLRLRKLREVTPEEIQRAAKRWANQRSRYSQHRAGSWSVAYFGWIARRWLRFEGRLKPPRPVHQPFAKELDHFSESMASEQGLAKITIESRRLRVAVFLRWFSHKRCKFRRVSLLDVDAYLAHKAREWNLVTLASEAGSLKAFFRHAEYRGWCSSGIAEGIKSPPVRRASFELQGPRWTQVLQLLRETNGAGPADIRAKALLSLFSIYGLRSSEVIRLRLTDIDWKKRTITICRSKRGGFQQFPIQHGVGKAVRRYIETSRPQCLCPNVFVTLRAPYRPMGTSTMPRIVSSRMKPLGINSRHKGPHSLRHACATHLLSKGLSLKEIADFLGHRDCQSVGVYAKFSLDSLRQVANLDLVGAL